MVHCTSGSEMKNQATEKDIFPRISAFHYDQTMHVCNVIRFPVDCFKCVVNVSLVNEGIVYYCVE